ncbi:MAG: hypothetical protein K0Q50_1213 [Vampirovibrio sp.]|jgi:hypothetical protein|nr:hypothetical protein [Vampirovibrio sp.]
MAKSASAKQNMELCRPGEIVKYSGEYILVDEQGNRLDFDVVTLDEGEAFPKVNNQNLCYMLNATCQEESCEVIGGETPDIE